MSQRPVALFSLPGTDEYAARVATKLEIPVAPIEVRKFEDGEYKIRPLLPVEGHDVYVVHALHGDPDQTANDKLCRLLFLINTFKDHGAERVTAILPYLCYARKDRRTQPYDPVTSRYVSALFDAVGTDRVMAIEVHNDAAFESGFRMPTRHIETADLFAEHFAGLARHEDVVVISPDAGGVKRAERFRRALEQKSGRMIGNAFVEKYRSGGVVTGGTLVGEVTGKTGIIIDDLISTGGTLLRGARACRARGARRIFAAAAHGLFTGGAAELFASNDIDGLVIADTIPLPDTIPPPARDRITVVDSTAVVAQLISKARGDG